MMFWPGGFVLRFVQSIPSFGVFARARDCTVKQEEFFEFALVFGPLPDGVGQTKSFDLMSTLLVAFPSKTRKWRQFTRCGKLTN